MDETNITLTDESEDWDNITLDDDVDEDGPEPDSDAGDSESAEGEEESPAESDVAEDSEGQGESATKDDGLFELKHFSGDRKVTREEAIELAQKGLDYDRVKEKLSEHETVVQQLEAGREVDREAVEFLTEMASARGIGLRELIDETRAAVIAEAEGVDLRIAVERVKLDREKRDLEVQKAKITTATQAQDAGRAETERRIQEAAVFAKTYPDVQLASLPDEVWQNVAAGIPLVGAYAMHENSKLRMELQAKETEAKNRARSAGSRTTSGESSLDEIDKFWYEEDD